MTLNHFGYDRASSIEDFFQKVLVWKNDTKPSELTVKTAQKFVKMIQSKPICLSVWEYNILIEYDNRTIEVKDNFAEIY
jgi:hypothetical protein